MKHETLYIIVRVSVEADLKHISEIVNEVETYSKASFTDTANVNILETEIFMSRVNNPHIHKIKRPEKAELFNSQDLKR